MRWLTSKAPVSGKHKKLGEFKIVVDVPQIDGGADEAAKFFGGMDNWLAFTNRAVETAAKNGARAAARGLGDEAKAEDLAENGKEWKRIRELAHDYTPQSSQERGISAAKGKVIANELSKIVADPTKQTFTREELEALLAAAK